jgi:NADH-quinone oxidoreductase subunit M
MQPSYHMGVDGISLPFIILTTGLMPLCILASWQSIQHRVKEYMIAFLVLETMMVGTFARSTWCCSTCSSRPA